MEYLYKFFGNLLLDENNMLTNADMYLFTDKITANTDKKAEITDKFAINTDTTEKLDDVLLDFLFRISDWLAEEKEITNTVAQKITNKSAESVKKYFAALVVAGVLIATGANKGRKYKLAGNI